jgi:N-glycosylase/DNA lyase
MKIYEENGNLILSCVRDFDLKETFDCGQCFRWEKVDDAYLGIAYGLPLKISQNGDTVTLYSTNREAWDNVWSSYFDMNRNYGEIKKALSEDPVMKDAISFGEGIRICVRNPLNVLFLL